MAIQFQQLKPGTQFDSSFEISNNSNSTANAGIELENFNESKPELSSYIQITIQEMADEPKVVYGPATLSELYLHGYTTLSPIAANQTKKYSSHLIVDKNIPSKFQDQQLQFDIKLGTELLAASPQPIVLSIQTEQRATSAALPLLKNFITALATPSPTPNQPSPAILGASTTEPDQLAPPTPATTSPQHSFLLTSFLTAFFTAALLFLVQLLLSKVHRHSD